MTRKSLPLPVLLLLIVGMLSAATWLAIGKTAKAQLPDAPQTTDGVKAPDAKPEGSARITLFDPLTSDRYEMYEKVLLCLNVGVAIAGLLYALMLVGQVKKADQGTPRMQEIARAVREGADAYLFRQFRVVGVLIVVITVALYLAASSSGVIKEIAIGRALAFLAGSIFSATVGFVGMRLATVGKLRDAA